MVRDMAGISGKVIEGIEDVGLGLEDVDGAVPVLHVSFRK